VIPPLKGVRGMWERKGRKLIKRQKAKGKRQVKVCADSPFEGGQGDVGTERQKAD